MRLRQSIPRITLLVLVLVSASMAGCIDTRPYAEPVFRVDEVKHWFEGNDRLVVRVTFTNQQTFTPSGIFPELNVMVVEEQQKSGTHDRGQETQRIAARTFSMLFLPPGAGPFDGARERWIFEEFSTASGSNAPARDGPIQIAPGDTLTREFDFPIINKFNGDEGHYEIELHFVADYPQSFDEDYKVSMFSEFITGCFNYDTPEFYGVPPNGGLSCRHWDCTDADTSSEYTLYQYNGKPKQEHIPDCSATDAVGPYYE